MINLSNVPASLRPWVIGIINQVDDLSGKMQNLEGAISTELGRYQRPTVSKYVGRESMAYPPPLDPYGRQSASRLSGPVVRTLSTTGLVKVTCKSTVIIRPAVVSGGVSGQFNLGMGFDFVKSEAAPSDYDAVFSGDFSQWAIREVSLGSPDAPVTAGVDYKFNVNGVYYVNLSPGEYVCRSQYYLGGDGYSANVYFADRLLLVEPI